MRSSPALVTIGVVKNEHIGQAYGAIRKAGTVVVTGVSNELESEPSPGFNALSVAMLQKRIQGALYGMGSPRDAMPELLTLYSAGRQARRACDQAIHAGRHQPVVRRHALWVNIRGVIDFIPAGISLA
jgi:Zn-dependent alcohol dehydrogenase